MAPDRLVKEDVRTRRKIMHHITRYLNKQHPDKVSAFTAFYKPVVHEAITQVLAEERRARADD